MDINSSEKIWEFFSLMMETETSTNLEKPQSKQRELLKIINLLGQETQEIKNTPLLFIYKDGSVEKKFIVE